MAPNLLELYYFTIYALFYNSFYKIFRSYRVQEIFSVMNIKITINIKQKCLQ